MPELPRLRRAEASAYLLRAYGLEVAATTLATYATKGGGPRYNKAGRIPLYPINELDMWAKDRLGSLVSNSSEVGRAA